MEKYNPQEIETKWQAKWAKNKAFKTPEKPREGKKKYILDMFPYPSGAGLHVGHVESYTATDIYSRYLRMKGFDVLHPQGFDAFGLPAENYAVQTGVHPAETTKKAIETFKQQIDSMGFSYDWEREVISSDPAYYKWTQWLFLLLYKNGLAYKKKAKVNWCPECQTVLANEQAEGGKCDRCGSDVIQKDLEQWFFKITDFIEDSDVGTDVRTSVRTSGLLSGLQKVDWPESTKLLQKNWIGKSEGVEFKMQIVIASQAKQSQNENEIATSPSAPRNDDYIEVFTTRIDTVFGVTYAVVAPEHEILEKLKDQIQNWEEVKKYLEEAKNKTDLERMEAKEKTGVELQGVKVVNPFNGEAVPLFVADYVLGHYGTGAVMAVPAHDERDFEFAKKYNLLIKSVISPADKETGEYLRIVGDTPNEDPQKILDEIHEGKRLWDMYGRLHNSREYDGLYSEEAKEKMAAWLEEKGIGKKKINYRLRDWLVSRQRYWGAPIPIIYCEKCGEVPVPEDQLPVMLPTDVDFKPTGESPLKYSEIFQKVKCPVCGGKAKRESDTMDTFVCSSWYYLRYSDPKNDQEFASKANLEKWLPVDLYVGGAEHSVLHLLYSRFFTKVLHKLGYLNFDEPFLKLRHQGTILSPDGTKMSKSKGNVVNPDEVVEKFGADALRMYEMFMGPLEDAKPWNTKGTIGIYRFLEKVWKVAPDKENLEKNEKLYKPKDAFYIEGTHPAVKKELEKTIKKVENDIKDLKFNTAISQLMIFINTFCCDPKISKKDWENFIKLLAPFAPHLSEELWEKLGHKESIFNESWPEFDEKLTKDEEIDLVVQVNGKLRDMLRVPTEIQEEEAKKQAQESQKVAKFLEGQKIKKVIFVPGKLINFVV